MRIQFALSGTIMFDGLADAVPPPGTTVSFVTQTYKKGIEADILVSATVTSDLPHHYDFTGPETVVTVDVDEFVLPRSDADL